MRLQLDTDTAKRLDTYRTNRGLRNTHGHADTIRALLDDAENIHALQNVRDSVEETLQAWTADLPFTMATAASEALHTLIFNAVKALTTTSQTRTAGTPAANRSRQQTIPLRDEHGSGDVIDELPGHTNTRRTRRTWQQKEMEKLNLK